MSVQRLWAAVLLVFFTAGCAAQMVPPPARLPALADVLARLRGRGHLSSFRSVVLMEIQVSNPGEMSSPLFEFFGEENETFTGKAVLLWKAPEALRLEILSPFGSPVFVAVAKGGEVRALSIPRGRYYVGRTDRASMARWLGLSVSSSLMLRILQGGVPVLEGEGTNGMRLGWSGEMGALRLEVPPEAGGGIRQVAFLDLKRLDPILVKVSKEGSVLEVRYGPMGRIGADSLPAWVEIEDAKQKNRVRFRLLEDGGDGKGVRPPDDALSDDLFELNIPPGALVVPLDGERVR